MSDRPLQVGDLVLVIDHPSFTEETMRHYIGHTGKVLGASILIAGNWYIGGATQCSDGVSCSFGPATLKRIPPKSDPIADFQKCDDEFLEDMQRWLRVKV